MMADFDSPLDQEFLDAQYEAKREVIGDDLARPRQFIIGRLNTDGSVSTTVNIGEYGRVWVRQPGENTGDAVEAINTILQPHEISFNRPVMVRTERGKLRIVEKAPESANYDAQLPVSSQRAINRSQIRVALIYPSQPDSSFYAYYAGGIFQLNGEAYRVTDTPSSNFSGSVPGSDAVSVKVEVDPKTSTWYETVGDAFTTTSLEEALKDGDLDTARTQGRFLIGWVRLYDGQTAIENEDILMAEQMLDVNDQRFDGAWNGTLNKNFDLLVASDGATVTASLSATEGGDMIAYFSIGEVEIDTDPTPETVILTPGTDTVPQINHVFIRTNDLLDSKTSTYLEDWPDIEHVPIAIVILRSAATTQTDGALGNQNINNRPKNDASNNQGWIQIAGNNIRSQGPKWLTGVTPTITIVTNGGSPDNVLLSNTSGLVRQFNSQTFPALDMQQYTIDAVSTGSKTFTISDDGDLSSSFPDGRVISVHGSTGNDGSYTVASTVFSSPDFIITVVETIASAVADGTMGDDIHIQNRNGDNYVTVTDLNGELSDSTGASMTGKYFWITFAGIINKTDTPSHLMALLPSDSYNTQANALADVNNTKTRQLPTNWDNTGFLIAETLFRHQPAASGTWTEIETNTLLPLTGGGVGAGSIVDPITSFSDAVFDWFNSVDPTKLVEVDLSGLTTATTRTATWPDKDGTVAMLSDVGAAGVVGAHNPQGRLGLTSGDSNDESDVTGATLYYTPHLGDEFTSLDALLEWQKITFVETSLSLAGHTANTLYDIWGFNNAGTLDLESTSWGTQTAYNITAMTAADPCVITYTNGSQIFAVGDDICIQGITGNINTVTHVLTSVTAIGGGAPNFTATIEINTTGLTYTSGGTVRLLDATRATAINIATFDIPIKAGYSELRYLGTILIGGDGADTHMTESRQFVANYYNRVHRKIKSNLDVAGSWAETGTGAYFLPSLPNSCNDGLGRVSYVAPFGGTDLHGIWGTAGFPSASGSSSVIVLEQNNIQDFNRSPESDGAFAAIATSFGALFASLFANSQNEGYNYVQQLVGGITGVTHTFWGGSTDLSSKYEFGLRGYVNL